MDRTTGFLHPELETCSWDEQVARLESELGAFVTHAYENAPAVKARFDALGMSPGEVRSLDDLVRVPVLPKSALVELQRADPPFGGILAVPMAEIAHVFQSPGPIYDPMVCGQGWGFDEAFTAAGFRPGDVCMNTFAYHITPAGMMLDLDLRRVGCAVVPTGVGERGKQVEILRGLGINGYVGMASFLMQIAEKAVEAGLDPRRDFDLKIAWSLAEPLPPHLRQTVEETFGCLCRQGYGTADVGCIGFECYHMGGWHLTTRSIVEIVDPTTGTPLAEGETGEVVVTRFNRGYPLIRFGTGDLSALDTVQCDCGRTAPKLRGWLGRADDLVKVRGVFVHPGQLRSAMGEFPEVTCFRAVAARENGQDTFTVYVDAPASKTDALAGRIRDQLREVLRIGAVVRWAEPGFLPDDGTVLEDKRSWD